MDEVKRVLEIMNNQKIEADILHYSSAINACKNSGRNTAYMDAMDLMQTLLVNNVKPNIVTFANLAGAHKAADVEMFEHLLLMLPKHHVQPNSIFVETFLSALFHGRLAAAWSVDDVARQLEGVTAERLALARSFLQDVKAKNIKLTKLSSFIDQYLI